MDIIEDAKKELESSVVAYMEFALEFKNEPKIVYCFYEGLEDRNFYSLRIKSYFEEYNYYDFICRGRENVMKVYNLVKSHPEYKKAIIGYFLDKDFESIINNPDIFTIPCYSIENLFALNDSVESILLNEFNISKRDSDFKKCIEIYENLREKFTQECQVFNAWLACQTDLRLKNQVTTRLNIDDIVKGLFDKIVESDLSEIKFPENLKLHEGIEMLFSMADKIQPETLADKINSFRKENLVVNTRGKFIMRFLISFLRKLQDEIGKKDSKLFERKYSCNLRFEFATAISQLGSNVKNPRELYPYLNNIRGVA